MNTEIVLENLNKHYIQNSPLYESVDFFMSGIKDNKKYILEILRIISAYSTSQETHIPIYNNIVLVLQGGNPDLIAMIDKINLYFKSKDIDIVVSCEFFENFNLQPLVDFIKSGEDKTLFIILQLENFYLQLSSHLESFFNTFQVNFDDKNYFNLINNVDYLCSIDLGLKGLILDSDYSLPFNEDILKPLYSIDKLAMNGLKISDHQEIVDELANILKEKGTAEAILYINKSEKIEDKDFLKLQLFYKLREEKGVNFGIKEIEDILERTKVTDTLSIRSALIIAEISVSIMKKTYTTEFLNYVIDNSFNYEYLDKSYEIAKNINNIDLINKVELKLKKYFPESEKLKLIELNRIVSLFDFEGALKFIDDNNLDVKIRKYLEFNCENEEFILNDYFIFLEKTYLHIPEYYYRNFKLIKRNILENKEIDVLYETIKYSVDKLDAYLIFKNKIELIEYIFFLPAAEIENTNYYDLAYEIFEDVFDSFILQEDIVRAYNDIDSLLSHERSQSLGSIFLYKLLLSKKESLSFEIKDNHDYLDLFQQEEVDIKRMMNFYSAINSSFFRNKNIVILDGSYFDIPEDSWNMSQNDFNLFIKFIFRISVESIGEKDYFEILNRNIIIIYNISRKSNFKNIDLYFLNNILSKLTVKGYVQQVRNLMLNLFIFSKDSLERKKLACLFYADVSLRLKDPICSLSYIIFSMTNEMDVHYFYSLFETTARALRDLKLYKFSLDFIGFLEEKIVSYDGEIYEMVSHKINFLKFSIEMHEVLKKGEDEYYDFIDRLLSFYNFEKSIGNEVEPVIIILLQMYKFGVTSNYLISEEFLEIIEQIKGYNRNDFVKNIVEIVIENNFSVIFDNYKKLLSTYYYENLEKDFVNFRTIIKTNLNVLNLFNSYEYAFICEMLVDNTYSDIGSKLIGKNIEGYENFNCFVGELNSLLESVDIFYLTLDQLNNLVVCYCSCNNNINIFKYLSFDLEKYHEWNSKYPQEYGFYNLETDGNLFYESISSLNIGSEIEISRRSIFFIDPLIHSITPKVFNSNSIFWGISKSISLSPSIRWLSNNIIFQKSKQENNVLKAWISDDISNGYLLNAMASNFSEEGGVFEKYNIELDRTNGLPKSISNSKLAIIAAHGGISYTNSHFSAISDEGNLRVHYLDFANQIENCTVVILFVCNSGRFDSHPEYSTTISLQKELLNRGCSAVISSPWPLKGFMTFKWLPEFMKAWVDEKKQLQDAVFEANLYIQTYYNDPSDSLALTIYGNPFVEF